MNLRTATTSLSPPASASPTSRCSWTLQFIGQQLHERQSFIRRVQWVLVLVYGLLLVLPALPAPLHWGTTVFLSIAASETLGGWARILFWCVWWPGVILSVLVFGQFWCGVLCPDGAVTEFASRHGRAWRIPSRLRWAGWPLVLFVVMTLLEAIVDIRGPARNTLLVLGGISLAALLVGLGYGKGKRVWCRYLCPTAGLFSLLSRCAFLHFRVDRAAWDAAPRPIKAIDCPPMLDVRRLRSNEKCSMCGRCSGHRQAVVLAWRPSGQELFRMTAEEARLLDGLVILYLLLGLTLATGQSFAPSFSAFSDVLPATIWRYGLLPVGYGLVFFLPLLGATGGRWLPALRLVYGLIPLGGISLALMAIAQGWSAVGADGFVLSAIGIKTALLGAGFFWSAHLLRGLLPTTRAWGLALVSPLLFSLLRILA